MKKSRTLLLVPIAALLVSGISGGCSSKDAPVSIPFTEITWGATLEDVTEFEGSDYTTYDSVYNGTTYVYPKSYEGIDGDIKYMFDDNGALMCVAWQCAISDSGRLEEVYNDIHSGLEDTYGESGYDTENTTAKGDVWYLDSGDIILSAVTTEGTQALLYSYLHPDVSNSEE